MSQTNSLTAVVKSIDSIPKNLPPSEKVIIFNRKDRRVLDKKPLFSGSHIEYYQVSTTEIATYRDLSLTVEDYSTNRKIGLLVNYQASCEPNNERQLVEALCTDGLPGLDLNKRIERWTRDLTRDRATDFIDHFVTQLRWLERELRQKGEDIGLRLDVQVAPDKSYMYYLISTARSTQPLAVRDNLVVSLHDVTNDRNMAVGIAYTARLRDTKNREQAIKELGDEHNCIEDALDEKLREWVYEFVGDQTAKFIDNYDGQFASLKIRLENNAKGYLNLLLDTRIAAEGNPVEQIIFKTKDPSNIAHGTHTILVRGIATGRDINIVLSYQAGFALGDRQRVAQAFSSSKSLASEINRRLETWVARFMDQRTADEFITHYTDAVQDLKEFIQQKANTETGLHLELRILLDKQDKLTTFEIGSSQRPADLAVHVKDYDSELKLKFHTILLVNEDNIINAVLRSQPRDEFPIASFVKKKINEFLIAEVTLDQFCYELKSSVRDRLLNYLNLSLQEYGRKIRVLDLGSDDVSLVIPKEIIEIDCTVECEVKGYSRPVLVRNIVQMLPDRSNLAMFRKMVPERSVAGETDPLQVWVESKLKKIVKPKLLQERYIDILTKFDVVSEAIKREMQQSASEIGFSVEQLVSVPDLKHDILKRDFSIEIAEERYRTSDANVEVKLNTEVTARIENFEVIETYLDHETDVRDLIKSGIHSTIRDYLDNVDPERYYMRFYHPGVDKQGQPIIDSVTKKPEIKSVKQELEEKIREFLEKTFGAKVINVVPRQLNTDIIDRFKELRGKIGRFEFEIRPPGGEPIKFFAEFQVLGVEANSWYLFQERIEDLQRMLQTLRQEHNRLKTVYDRRLEKAFVDDDEGEIENMRERIYALEQKLSGVDVIRQSIESGVRDQLTWLGGHLSTQLSPQEMGMLKIKINEWARASVKRQYGLEIIVENVHRLSTPEEDRQAALRSKAQEAKYKLKEHEVDKLLASVEADEKQHAINLNMLTSDRQAKLDEIKLLRAQRAKLMSRADPEPAELAKLNEEIEKLINAVSVPTLEGTDSQLDKIAAQPALESGSFLELLGQISPSSELGSFPTPSQIESQTTAITESAINAEFVDAKEVKDAEENSEA